MYTNAPKQHFILELCCYQLLKHKNISILLKNCLIRKWWPFISEYNFHLNHVVQPAVYIAETAISSGAAGTSSEGAKNTVAIAAGLALVSIAAASTILVQLGKNTPIQTSDYSGPPLSYYINKFQPSNTVEASVPSEPQSVTVEASVPSESQSSSTIPSSSELKLDRNEASVPEVEVKLNEFVETDQSLSSVSWVCNDFCLPFCNS